MFSLHSLVELCKALLKAALIGGTGAWTVWHHKEAVLSLIAAPLAGSAGHMGELVVMSFLAIAGTMVLIAGVDVPFKLWDHHRKLKMTKEEVRQENKETEGDPQVKGRIRAQQRDMARKRMMAEVPKADVIVTNPTHYSVALKYEDGKMRAPRVVAKGSHLLALKIREIAQQHHVPLLEAPPLARALYHHAELGDEIPQTLYNAVAEVLAYVYQLRRHREYGGKAPSLPDALEVPAELDPENAQQTRTLTHLKNSLIHERTRQTLTFVFRGVNARSLTGPLLIFMILGMMVLPLPAFVLDMMFTFNIALSIMVLLVSIHTHKPLDFAVFPTVLLLTTLLRLSLNVASTRIVLMEGHTGPDAAGKVIEAFGHYLVGGNYTVGIVVFIILVVINFIVITKDGWQ